ncbi:MAG: acylphosphatase [Planctomycetota bacterium]|jgi:acylphosphatase
MHLLITGRVQGVGFRWHTQRAAAQAGCTGWVRNLPDGRVEVVAEGGDDALAQLRAACAAGPSGSRVERVVEQIGAPTGEFAGFEVTG